VLRLALLPPVLVRWLCCGPHELTSCLCLLAARSFRPLG
jgi:hypothetical protein